MDKRIFIINGPGGVGKDTFVRLVAEHCPYPVSNFSSVDKVKEIARMAGWNGGKSEKDRKFLSDMKLLTTAYNDMPMNSMRKEVERFMASAEYALFLHVREPGEILRCVNEFGAKTVVVDRPSVKHITSNMADRNVFEYTYDVVIKNYAGLSEFSDIAKKFIDDVMSGKMECYYGN